MALNRQTPINQGRIIHNLNIALRESIFKDTGNVINEGGICGGLAVLYLIAKTKGEERDFFNKLDRIAALKHDDIHTNLPWIAEFIQSAQYAFMPKNYNKKINQGDIDKIYTKQDGHVASRYRVGVSLKKEKLASLFNSVAFENQMLYVAANDHAIAVIKKNNKFCVYDPNSMVGEVECDDANELAEEVSKCLFVKRAEQSIDIKIKSFDFIPEAAQQQADMHHYPSKQQIFANINANDAPSYYKSMMKCAEANDIAFLDLLLANNANPFEQRGDNKLSPFFIAAMFGHHEMLARMLSQELHSISSDDLMVALAQSLTNGNELASDFLLQKYFSTENIAAFHQALPILLLAAINGGNLNHIKYLVDKAGEEAASAFLQINTNNLLAKHGLLAEAVKSGNAKIIDYLLDKFTLQCIFDANKIALAAQDAIQAGRFACFTKLLSQLPRSKYEICLRVACEYSQIRCINEIVNKNYIQVKYNHIIHAAKCGKIDVVKLLLDKESAYAIDDREKLIALKSLITGGSAEDANRLGLLDDKEFMSNLLLSAIYKQDVTLTQQLQKTNVTVNEDNATSFRCLFRACADDNLSMVQTLVAKFKIDPNQKITADIDENNQFAEFQNKSLAVLTIKYSPEITLWLLQNGLRLSMSEMQEIALTACRNGGEMGNRIITELIKNGMNVNTVVDGGLLLDTAIVYNKPELISNLLQNNVNLSLITDEILSSYLLTLCRKGHINLLKEFIDREPRCRTVFTVRDVERNIIVAAKHGASKGIESLLLLHEPDTEVMNKALKEACEHGKSDAVEILLHHNAVFTEDNMLNELYKAYGHENVPVDSQNYHDVVRWAQIANHEFIAILAKESMHAQTNEFTHSSAVAHAPTMFQKQFTVLIRACQKDDYSTVERIIVKNKYDYSGDEINPIEEAAKFGNKEVVYLLLKNNNQIDLNDFIDSLIKRDKRIKTDENKSCWQIIATLLEAMEPAKLTQSLQALLIPYQGQIREAYQAKVLYNNNNPRKDALQRQQMVTLDKNALGIFLHMTTELQNRDSPQSTAFKK